MIQINYCW